MLLRDERVVANNRAYPFALVAAPDGAVFFAERFGIACR
jgi:hypothetical protein